MVSFVNDFNWLNFRILYFRWETIIDKFSRVMGVEEKE